MNEKGKVVTLGFSIMWYQPPLKLLKYQTSKSTETHLWYVWCCQSFV